ncbi:hypothetical protein HYT51_02035 [Candidatus Woesearchaeota archaeon]|nr:hypothetical protein [Candidatus Woesearchaeota archaeon]
MSETDIIVPELKIVQETVCDIPALLKMIKAWFHDHRFLTSEDEYEEGKKGDAKNLKVKYTNAKKVDDYSQFKIIVIVKALDQKPVMVETKGKKQRKTQCTLDFKIVSKIQSDYEAVWEGHPVKKFFRGIYDSFVTGEKKAKLETELKKLTDEFYNETKAYLTLQRA